MEDNFWNDERVKEYLRLITSVEGDDYWQQEINKFKRLKQPPLTQEKKDWEIVEIEYPDGRSTIVHNGSDSKIVEWVGESLSKIKKVRRLSDNEIISIGDANAYGGNVSLIYIEDGECRVLTDSGGWCALNKFMKQKRTYWFVNSYYEVHQAFEGASHPAWSDDSTTFSTKELAENYILMNKPCLNILEVERMMSLNILDGCPHKHSKHIHGTATINSLKELVKNKIK